ncbi:MAG: glycosyltransferase [Paramuribaculum sp.]|nr:glycosyltransferase [Paramuribaculum sp.]
MTPLISVITVTYNAANTVATTMHSVTAQTFTDFEHLIVDGASSDATLDIVRKYASDRTVIMSERDNGIYDAMNKGRALARGRYLIYLNAGDAFHRADTLSIIACSIVSNGYPGVVYGQTDIVDSKGRRLGSRHLTAPETLSVKDFSKGMLVCHQAFIVRADITSEYNTDYRFSADYEWCIKCLQRSDKNQYIPEVLIDYLSEGVTTANHRKSLMERFKIMCRYYGVPLTVWRHLSFIPRFLTVKFGLKNR